MSIGFCPICNKPICEISEWRFDGKFNKISVSGFKANELMLKHKDEIVYSLREMNYQKTKLKKILTVIFQICVVLGNIAEYQQIITTKKAPIITLH